MSPDVVQIGRRAFLRNGTVILSAAGLHTAAFESHGADETSVNRVFRVGLVTDLHYAEKQPAGTRHYRETLAKLTEAQEVFQRRKPAMVVELGDLIDSADSVQVEQRYLKRIHKEFEAIAKDRHYVLGNHCVDLLTKKEFLNIVERERSYYSFDRGGFHFIVLDSCFRADGVAYGRKNFEWTDANIPEEQVQWLKADMKKTELPTIVFAHQRLDVKNNYGVKNASQVRNILESSGQVNSVLQGHSHKNDYQEIGGIHYCTLRAMVEGSGVNNNGYSTMDIHADGSIYLKGFRQQKTYEWRSAIKRT